jgi:hypothetical protein
MLRITDEFWMGKHPKVSYDSLEEIIKVLEYLRFIDVNVWQDLENNNIFMWKPQWYAALNKKQFLGWSVNHLDLIEEINTNLNLK